MLTLGAKEGEALKEEGIARAAARRAEILKVAAVDLARKNGRTNAEEVLIALEAQNYDSRELGPAAGALFRGKEWVFTGQWFKPIRANAHASMIRVWRLKAPLGF